MPNFFSQRSLETDTFKMDGLVVLLEPKLIRPFTETPPTYIQSVRSDLSLSFLANPTPALKRALCIATRMARNEVSGHSLKGRP
jgi:hypothetical protein